LYQSKHLLEAHGRFEANIVLRMKDTNTPFVEVGSSQSVNVRRHISQMIEESVLNALYKLNHRRGERVFNKDNYNEDVGEYLESYRILSYKIFYYEDRRYSYKRERLDGRYKFVTYRDGVVYRVEDPYLLTPQRRGKLKESQFKTQSGDTYVYSRDEYDQRTLIIKNKD
jgi:hypothetical protein